MKPLTKEQKVETLRTQLLAIEFLLTNDASGFEIVSGLGCAIGLEEVEYTYVWTEMHDHEVVKGLYTEV